MEMWQLLKLELKTNKMKIENFEWFGLNAIWAGWTWAMFTNSITWILGVVGAVTLIWFNVERALTSRKERELLNKKDKDEKAN
jgi:hypothetical protein